MREVVREYLMGVEFGDRDPSAIARRVQQYAFCICSARFSSYCSRPARALRERAEALAALVALVFVAHPLQTMAASYIVQRAESIASPSSTC